LTALINELINEFAPTGAATSMPEHRIACARTVAEQSLQPLLAYAAAWDANPGKPFIPPTL
jgi:hypothetical protein